MLLKAYWAYDFVCDLSIGDMLAAFNAAGPWQWKLRDSAWYGDYLNTRPTEGVRVRVHEYPQAGEAGVFVGLRNRGFSALLQIEAKSLASQAEVDEVLRGLLNTVNAQSITEIEPYD
jgi:hypothetical protein